MGLVAAVYRTPLPVVMDMPLAAVVAWMGQVPHVLPYVEPMMQPPKPKPTAGELVDQLRRAGVEVVTRG